MTPQIPERLPADFFAYRRKGQPAHPQTAVAPGRSSIDVIRGSSNISLSDQGRQEAQELAQKTKGQFTKIYSSTMDRAKETAEAIAKTNPKAGRVRYTPALTPWFLGQHEGQPTSEVIEKINHYIEKEPNVKVPGRGKSSTKDGQSFNSFRREFLSFVRDQKSRLKPGDRILDVTHYRDIRLLQSWAKKGMPSNLTIDTAEMLTKGDEAPGDLFYLDDAARSVEEVDEAKKDGLYFARHGATAWNEQNSGGPTADVGSAPLKEGGGPGGRQSQK